MKGQTGVRNVRGQLISLQLYGTSINYDEWLLGTDQSDNIRIRAINCFYKNKHFGSISLCVRRLYIVLMIDIQIDNYEIISYFD